MPRPLRHLDAVRLVDESENHFDPTLVAHSCDQEAAWLKGGTTMARQTASQAVFGAG